MKGFNMEVIVLYNITTALSNGKETVGLRYTKMQGTRSMVTTVMWETQVERALCLVSKPWFLSTE